MPKHGCHDILDVVLSGHSLNLCFTEGHFADDEHSGIYHSAESSLLVNVTDVRREWHMVNLTATAFKTLPIAGLDPRDADTTSVHFNVLSVDEIQDLSLAAFFADFDLEPEKRLRTLSLFRDPQVINITEFEESFMVAQPIEMADDESFKSSLKDDISDIDDELESLMLLEHEAARLDAEISARKSKIYGRIRQQNSKTPLQDLLQECDGIICAARVLAERICDKVGVNVQPQYVQMRPHLQQMLGYAGDREALPQNARNCTKSQYVVAASVPDDTDETHVSTLSTASVKNGTTSGKVNFSKSTRSNNVLLRVLGIIAGALGLVALCALIRSKCMSMRRRVERAADREERRNARAYRRAARRALMRKRWDNFVGAVTCFRTTVDEPRVADYEEKRALILQDAFLEQELDQAEKGQLMEAEIRELRHAHEIVASLVRSGESSHVPMRDPPPPLVPLPHESGSRSRASTATLPSYTSESLPDYSSSPEETEGSSTVVDGFRQYTPTNSDDDGRYTPAPASSTDSSRTGRTGYTPVSSVAAISPRCSAETLRTGQSKDSHESDM